MVKAHFTDQLWVENFRLTRSGFEELCQLIGPAVSPASVCCRKPVPTDERIAIALYKLATCAEYRVVGETFGVSKTTGHRCVYAVCFAIREQAKQHTKLPDLGEAQEIADRNNRAHHVPQVFGALDGTHVPILPPAAGYRDFVNRKGWPSIILQALVDDKLIFRDLCVGTPGSAHDAAVFASSWLFR